MSRRTRANPHLCPCGLPTPSRRCAQDLERCTPAQLRGWLRRASRPHVRLVLTSVRPRQAVAQQLRDLQAAARLIRQQEEGGQHQVPQEDAEGPLRPLVLITSAGTQVRGGAGLVGASAPRWNGRGAGGSSALP